MKTAIEMAREAGFAVDAYPDAGLYGRLERFAELVRADERKACASLNFRLEIGLTSEQDYKVSELILARNPK